MNLIDRVLLRNKTIFLGLPKSGSTSTSYIFNSESTHEFMHKEFSLAYYQLKIGQGTEVEYHRFLRKRLKSLPTNYDISTFNYLYTDYLAKNLPHCKYLFPIRPFESWLNSFINHIRADTHLYGDQEWHNKLGKALMGTWFDKKLFKSEESIQSNLQFIIPKMAQFWNEGVERVLKNKPNYTLIYGFTLIGENQSYICEFLDVKKSTLNLSSLYKNKAHFNTDYVKLERQFVSEVKRDYCKGASRELMKFGIESEEAFEPKVL